MIFKGIKIYATARSYSPWSIDEDGQLDELEHEFDGYDLIAYTFSMDNNTYGGEWEYDTIEDCKAKIDELLKEVQKTNLEGVI